MVMVAGLIVSQLTGCGQEGPLYLPGHQPPGLVVSEPVVEPVHMPEPTTQAKKKKPTKPKKRS